MVLHWRALHWRVRSRRTLGLMRELKPGSDEEFGRHPVQHFQHLVPDCCELESCVLNALLEKTS